MGVTGKSSSLSNSGDFFVSLGADIELILGNLHDERQISAQIIYDKLVTQGLTQPQLALLGLPERPGPEDLFTINMKSPDSVAYGNKFKMSLMWRLSASGKKVIYNSPQEAGQCLVPSQKEGACGAGSESLAEALIRAIEGEFRPIY